MEPIYDDSLENLLRITGMDVVSTPNQQNARITKTKEFSAILNELATEGQSEEDLTQLVTEMVSELDRECPYFNRPISISGSIDRAVKINESDEEMWSIRSQVVEGLLATSLGYAWRHREGEWAIVHAFSLTNDQEIEVLNGVLQRNIIPRGFAEIDAITIDYIRGYHEASEALQSIAGDLIDEVDVAIYNSSSTTDAVQRLGEIHPAEIYEDLPSEALVDIAIYVQGMIGFDESVPYELEIKHSFTTKDRAGEPFVMIPEVDKFDGGSKRVGVYVTGIAFTDGREIQGSHCIVTEAPHFALVIRVVHDESVGGEADYEATVLMQDIGHLEPLRDLLRASQ